MTSHRRLVRRFDLTNRNFEERTDRVNSLLRHFSIVAATGSILEAHLLARLGLSQGIPNLLGCGTDSDEVRQLCRSASNILLFITESICSDNGSALIQLLRTEFDSIKIIYLLQDKYLAESIRVLDTDAVLMVTSFGTGALAIALSELLAGRQYRDPAFIGHLSKPRVSLTRREQQVLQFLQLGLTNKQISVELSISSVTVRDYVQNLMIKLQANNRTMVVANAVNQRLISVLS